jgi:hypothetical protein
MFRKCRHGRKCSLLSNDDRIPKLDAAWLSTFEKQINSLLEPASAFAPSGIRSIPSGKVGQAALVAVALVALCGT